MPALISFIKNNKKYVIFFAVIMIVGFFLRTYHYEDLMRFGKDQARDTGIIRDIFTGVQPIPLLGPRAGGTEFKMGPIFYYFQLASAKIFGFSPASIAYPDLLFSLATIPLLLFFLKKYFDIKISLMLTALYAVSFFAVQNGRFAWNPNSLPFFSMLFLLSLLELVEKEQKRKLLWVFLAGISLGIGVQLHTLFILIMGMLFALFAIFFVWKKELNIKHVAGVILIALFLNIPQFVFEIKTDGQNTRNFITGITQKSTERNDPLENSKFLDIYWHIQSNALFVSAYGDDNNSDFLKLFEKIEDNKDGLGGMVKNAPLILQILLSIIFSTAGYFLIGYFAKNEKNESKKKFLALVILYASISFVVMFPLSHVLMLRYFLMLEFVPFLMLGLFFIVLDKKFARLGFIGWYILVSGLILFNIFFVVKELQSFKNGKGDAGIAIWSEEKFAGEFIQKYIKDGEQVEMVYEPQNANKFIRSLAYFEKSIDAPAVPYDATPKKTDEKVAYFTLLLNREGEKKNFMRRLSRDNIYEIIDFASHGRLIVYYLKLK